MAEITMADKQFMAKILYTQQKLEAKLVAARVGVSEKTIGKWAADGNWKTIRRRLVIGREEMLAHLYEQMEELNNTIKDREPGQRYANAKEADTLIKYSAAIRNFETDTAIADIINTGIRFLRFAQEKMELDELLSFADIWDEFIYEQIKQNN